VSHFQLASGTIPLPRYRHPSLRGLASGRSAVMADAAGYPAPRLTEGQSGHRADPDHPPGKRAAVPSVRGACACYVLPLRGYGGV
jgi:hypothetical protein